MRATERLSGAGRLTYSAVISAVAVGLALSVRVPIIPAAPFLLYEPSDVPLLVGALMLGPAWASGIAIVIAIILGLIGGGGLIGGISRLVGSMAIGVTAGWVYHRYPNLRHRATISIALGVAAYVVLEVLTALLLGPLFLGSFETALAMILPAVLPFNLIKGIGNGVIGLVILRALRILPAARGEET